jgi:DNA-binding LacI/PurR family transcriptional regulator
VIFMADEFSRKHSVMKGTSTLREVARLAGVSAAIASRVLNDDPEVRVRDETRRRIQNTAKSLSYVPNHVARSLRGARSGAIGLVMHDLDSPINVSVLEGARSRCAAAGYVTLLADAEELAADHSQLRTFLARGRLDGAILHAGYGKGDQLLEQASDEMPTVLVNSAGGGPVPSVRLDDEAAGALATDHLLDLGHRRIVFLGGTKGSQSSLRREAGYREALARHHPQLKADVVDTGWSADSGSAAAEQLLHRARLPTAVVVANAVTAAGVLSTLRDAHIAVPQDISLVAVQDAWFVEHLRVALTTVRLPLFELGSTAAAMVLDGIAGDRPDDAFLNHPPPELVLRRSTGKPSID